MRSPLNVATDALLASSPEIRALHLLDLRDVVQAQLDALATDPDVRERVALACYRASLEYDDSGPPDDEAYAQADAVLAALRDEGGQPLPRIVRHIGFCHGDCYGAGTWRDCTCGGPDGSEHCETCAALRDEETGQ